MDPYDPLNILGMPPIPGFTEPEPAPVIRSCQTCKNKPTCVPYKQGGMFLQMMGFTSTKPEQKTYGGQGGSQKVTAPAAAMLPMGCGGNAWEAAVIRPPQLVQRFFEDFVPPSGAAETIKVDPMDNLGAQGLPM